MKLEEGNTWEPAPASEWAYEPLQEIWVPNEITTWRTLSPEWEKHLNSKKGDDKRNWRLYFMGLTPEHLRLGDFPDENLQDVGFAFSQNNTVYGAVFHKNHEFGGDPKLNNRHFVLNIYSITASKKDFMSTIETIAKTFNSQLVYRAHGPRTFGLFLFPDVVTPSDIADTIEGFENTFESVDIMAATYIINEKELFERRELRSLFYEVTRNTTFDPLVRIQ